MASLAKALISSAKALIIDDNADHRNILSDLFRRAGSQPPTYSSGVIFLETADISETGCIILEHQMPEMTG